MSETTGGAYFRATGARELYGYWDTIGAGIGSREESVTETRYISYRLEVFLFLICLILGERYITTRIFYKKVA